MAELSTNVRYIKGIGETRAKALEKLGITTLRDLISYFPRSYEDRTLTRPIRDLTEGENVCSSIRSTGKTASTGGRSTSSTARWRASAVTSW